LHSVVALIFLLLLLNHNRQQLIRFAILPFCVIVGSFIGWRFLYYNELVPNTFYAKTARGLISYILGFKYVFGGVGAIGGIWLAVIPVVFARTNRTRMATYSVLAIAITFVFALYAGGDWMQGYRFFIPVAPFFAVLSVIGLSKIYSTHIEAIDSVKRIFAIVSILAALACASVFFHRSFLRGQMGNIPTGFSVRKGYSMDARDSVVQWLNEHNSTPFTVVSGEAGYMGYFSPNLRLIDMNGLFDKTIARGIKHQDPFNVNYVFERRPEYVLLFGITTHSEAVSDMSPASANLLTLVKDPRFTPEYKLVKTFPGFEIYSRKDLADSLVSR
jgi:hypothetical protein